MSVIQGQEVPSILQGLGWEARTLDSRTWRCRIPSGVGEIRLVVRWAGAWVYLSVLPFFDPESIKPWGAGTFPQGFLGRLLAVNRNLIMVKFALDDEGDVVLRAELPTESLQRREVETAAQTIVRTTEQYRLPVREALLEAARSLAATRS